jgi:hypothetical protein
LTLVDVAGVVGAVAGVVSVFLAANQPRSVVLTIANHTNLTLHRVADEHSHGGFAVPPDNEIPPQMVSVFGSQSTGGSVFTGTEGSVTYSGDGLLLVVSWDNPDIGSNSCNAVISGQNVGKFNITHECGSGNTNAGMKYELSQRVPADFTGHKFTGSPVLIQSRLENRGILNFWFL